MRAPVDQLTSRLIELALDEDVGTGDVTTQALISADAEGRGAIVAREGMVLSGLAVAEFVFERLDPTLRVRSRFSDGEEVSAGSVIQEISGRLQPILVGERTALNFLQRLCGIATHTRRHVRALSGSGTRLLDTRKTAPGWRVLEKAAVRHGGGGNHRMALYDGVLIKDNHLLASSSLTDAVGRARTNAPALVKIEVEVEDLDGLRQAIEAGADVVLLDNMSDEAISKAVHLAKGRVLLEVSGGVTLGRLPALAKLGVDFVSCGALTHSAPSVDLALDLEGD